MSRCSELTEASRSIAYASLTPESIVSRVQATDGLGDDNGSGAEWQIRRRGITYSVTLGTCSVDDPSDGTGPHDPSQFCTTGAGQATAAICSTLLGNNGSVAGTGGSSAASADCGIDANLDGTVDSLVAGGSCSTGCGSGSDSNPDDYKRIVSLVRWKGGKGSRYSLQDATVPNPGQAAAPGVLSISAPPLVAPGAASTVTIGVTTTRPATTVGISSNGSPLGAADMTTNAMTWSYPWQLGALATPVATATDPAAGEVLDGTYVISARALDTYGSAGATRAATVQVDRRVPYPVKRFRAGLRGGSTGDLDLEWTLNRERDVIGYRVFLDVPNTTNDVQVCGLAIRTACSLQNPPAGTNEYYAIAYDRDASGNERLGARSASNFTVTRTNQVPNAITTLQATPAAGGSVRLDWTLPAVGDPDTADSVDFYRIYRDGAAYADRYDRTSTGTVVSYVDTDANGVAHDYRVAAVDTRLGESTVIGPVRG